MRDSLLGETLLTRYQALLLEYFRVKHLTFLDPQVLLALQTNSMSIVVLSRLESECWTLVDVPGH